MILLLVLVIYMSELCSCALSGTNFIGQGGTLGPEEEGDVVISVSAGLASRLH
jgi:hypothetical protein